MTWLCAGILIVFTVRPVLQRNWRFLLSPIVLIGGCHLIYNASALSLAHPTDYAAQDELFLGSFIAFCLGVFIGTAGRPVRELRLTSLKVQLVPTSALFITALATWLILVLRAGSPPILANDTNAARLTFFPNGGYSTLFVVCASSTLVAILIGLTSPGMRIRRSPYALVLPTAAALILASTGNRGMLITPLAALMIYWLARFKPKPARSLLLVVLVLVGFSIAGYLRNVGAYGASYIAQLGRQGYVGPFQLLAPLGVYVAGTSQTLARTMQMFPSILPYQNGVQFFSPLLHHQSVDLYLKEVFGLNFQGFGLALGAVNAFYLDFGPIGVLIGFAAMGCLAGFIYSKAGDRGGRWSVAYALVASHFILSNYGHPFAYMSQILEPVAILLLLRSYQAPPAPPETNAMAELAAHPHRTLGMLTGSPPDCPKSAGHGPQSDAPSQQVDWARG